MSRAKPGQGRYYLQDRARAAAADLGHDLGSFYQAEGKSKRGVSVIVGSRVIEGETAAVFRSVCRLCGLTAIVDQYQWERDGVGYGGKATKTACAKSRSAPGVPAQNGGS